MNTIRYAIYLIFFAIYSLPTGAAAQEDRYRVELLVLTHLDHDAEPREYRNLDDYSQSIDYLTPPPPEEEEETADEEAPVEEALAEVLAEELPADEGEAEVPRVAHVEEMSELMKENWRRLRLSAPFRPQQYLSWEQADDEPFPALRVHNLEVVLVEDPWAEKRALLEQEALEAQESADIGEEGEEGEEEEPGLPDPTIYYQLDGTVTLRRSRFLHLDIRLDWREPVFGETSFVEPPVEDDSLSAEPPRPETFLVHRLEQSRLVRTGRLEYFDHPVLGVLAIVTRIETEPAE